MVSCDDAAATPAGKRFDAVSMPYMQFLKPGPANCLPHNCTELVMHSSSGSADGTSPDWTGRIGSGV